MAGRKDASVNSRHQKISPFIISAAKGRNQRNRDNVDNADGDHCADGTKRIDFGPLFYILCHGAAQRPIGNIHAGITQHQNTVSNCHINNLYRRRPVRMGPECQHQYNGCKGRSNQQPGTVSSPSGMGFVTQPSDDRIVDGVPKPGKQHQSRHCTHSNSKNIRIKNHQEISHKHPTEITPHIAHAVSNFADQRHFYICIFLFHCHPPSKYSIPKYIRLRKRIFHSL